MISAFQEEQDGSDPRDQDSVPVATFPASTVTVWAALMLDPTAID